jgi:hypothetical protein
MAAFYDFPYTGRMLGTLAAALVLSAAAAAPEPSPADWVGQWGGVLTCGATVTETSAEGGLYSLSFGSKQRRTGRTAASSGPGLLSPHPRRRGVYVMPLRVETGGPGPEPGSAETTITVTFSKAGRRRMLRLASGLGVLDLNGHLTFEPAAEVPDMKASFRAHSASFEGGVNESCFGNLSLFGPRRFRP